MLRVRHLLPLRSISATAMIAISSLALAGAQIPKLAQISDLQLVSTRAEKVDYRGRHAVRLLALPGHENDDGSMLAIFPGSNFKDGVIELDVAGAPHPGSPANMRGFIGLAFHVQPQAEKFECFYVRPTNARADDQLQRNHAVQYVASPEFTWQKLRQDSPGVYESYADMEAGAWTHLKVEVAGPKARIYVNGANQPALIVNDLKLGDARGEIALWSHTSTDGYFANLQVRRASGASRAN